MDKNKQLLDYNGYIFDLDGTIYLGNQIIPGADRAIASLRSIGKQTVFLSNKPIETRQAYAKKLSAFGIPTTIKQVINSSYVTAQQIMELSPGAVVYYIGEAPLAAELEAAGLLTTTDPYAAEFLVAAMDREFNYQKLHHAMLALKNGARFFATNPDQTCPVAGGEIPDCAGMIGAISGVTGIAPERICGKPSLAMLETALNTIQLPLEECLMIGDRLQTDIQMGIDTGIDTALVLTGITSREMANNSPIQPTFVLSSVTELMAPSHS